MSKLWRFWQAIFPLLLLTAAASGQETASKTDFSKQAVVIEKSVIRVSFEADGSGKTETTTQLLVQSDAGVQAFGVLKFSYAKANDKVEIGYVRVRKPDGAVVTTAPDNVQDMPAEITRAAPFYSDLREIHVAVRGLAAGDTLEFQVRTDTTHPQIPGQFWYAANFTKNLICKDEELEIRVPKDKYVNVKSHDVQPKVRAEGPYRIYTWKTSNLEIKPPSKSAVPRKPEVPPPAVELSSFRSWEEVGRWYDGLQRERVTVSPEVTAKALELTKGMSTAPQKMEALYQYVSGNFRYIALAFGIGRYQPHAAADVLANEYGDCKDKHTLLASLLKAVGIQAWPVLINSQRKIEPDLPSPGQFDHVITAVQTEHGTRWLDSTPGVAPFGFLMVNLRDREGLLVYDNKAPELVRTPSKPPFPSEIIFTSDAKLGADGVLTSHVEQTVRGDMEVLMRAGFRGTPQAQWETLAQQISYASGFGGTVSAVQTNALESPEAPLRLSYEYTRKDYGDWENRRVVTPLPLMMMGISADEEKPKEPIYLGIAMEVIGKARMELPPGYTLAAPEAINLQEDFADYHAEYKLEKGALVVERRLIIKQEEVSPAEWDEFKKFAKAMSNDYGRFIDLKSTTGEKAPAQAEKENPQVAALLAKGWEALKGGSLALAGDYAHQVVALDPKYPGVWALSGSLAAMQNRPDEAIESYQKELELHPDNMQLWHGLAEYAMKVNRRRDAIETWRKLVKIQPENGEGLRNLGQLLGEQKEYKEAAGYLERAEKSEPDNATVALLLGNAYLGMGEREKARAKFDRAATLDPSPYMLNNIAYSLGDSKVDMERALEYGKKAVAAVEAESQKASLTALNMSDLNRMGFLAAYWDTLGWIYFQSNQLEQAEAYLKAAWTLSAGGVEGDHLAQVYEKKGDLRAAANLYELALSRGAGAEAKQRLENLRKKAPGEAKRLKKTARVMAPLGGNAGADLSRLRTTRIGAVPGIKNGSAEFFLLLKDGGTVEAVKFISGKKELRAAEKAIMTTHFDEPLPPGSQAKIVRRGFLSCSEYTKGCDFVVMTLEMVRSLE